MDTPAMPSTRIGHAGPATSVIGLGCMGMSNAYGPADDAASTAVIHRALELGVTHIDTADLYGKGHNERLVGRALAGRRDEVVLASKFGNRFLDDGRRVVDSSGAWARAACEASLDRLGTDHIDLYYLHRRNPEIPVEDTMEGLVALLEAGKIGAIGLSEVAPATLRAAHAIHPIAAVQMEYSLFSRDVEAEMLATCRELGVALVAYAPTGRGLLTGTFTADTRLAEGDSRAKLPRFLPENRAVIAAAIDRVRAVAERLDATPAQVALAWLLAQGRDVLPIPGTTKVEHLEANVAAATLELPAEVVTELREMLPAEALAVPRNTDGALANNGH